VKDPEPPLLRTFVLGPRAEDAAWGDKGGKNYLIPALDIIGFQFLLNQFNRQFAEEEDYNTDINSFNDNLHNGWVIDRDPFGVNQFGHPYQGSIYHGFARSAGLNYWEALGYDFAGSALWEVAGETTRPSLNDQITTSFGGSFFGEALFRMASYLLEQGGPSPAFWREFGAALISPAMGFNRLAYGDRFNGIYPSREPAVYTQFGIGGRRNHKVDSIDDLNSVPRDEVVLDFAMEYGMPGKPGYEYNRPFDYFRFEAAALSSADALPEDILVRGLLYGSDYQWGHSYQGVWGLYGTYEYISPEVFSISSTALAVGTTAQWRPSDTLAMQGTLLGGVGWAAVGTIADAVEDRTYHYGASPQAIASLRFLFSDVAAFELTGRGYYVGALGGVVTDESDKVLRGKAALTVRVYGHHALGLQYVASTRDAVFDDGPDSSQSIAALSLFYTYIGDKRFGLVE